jgi:hypothetical protein
MAEILYLNSAARVWLNQAKQNIQIGNVIQAVQARAIALRCARTGTAECAKRLDVVVLQDAEAIQRAAKRLHALVKRTLSAFAPGNSEESARPSISVAAKRNRNQIAFDYPPHSSFRNKTGDAA